MDREQEIRLQFLEEAQEYLGTIESALLTLSTSQAKEMDGVLRAAHSIKGGAAMMGFEPLSQVAHRLEDFFKVIKARWSSLEIDTGLETLLLQGVDRLHQIITFYREGHVIEANWLRADVEPILAQLYDRLGALHSEDETALLIEEGDQDEMVVLLFESEVEDSLQQFAQLLASDHFQAEVAATITLLQDLSGLGEMLELSAFSHLCQSIITQLQTTPEQATTIAHQGLQQLRQAQTLVLTGQQSQLSGQFDLSAPIPTPPPSPGLENDPEPDLELPLPHVLVLDEQDGLIHCELLDYDFSTEDGPEITVPPVTLEIAIAPTLEAETDPQQEPAITALSESLTPPRKSAPPAAKALPDKSDILFPSRFEVPESTVRVPVRQLDQLNDLFGELTIERNGLDLHLGRLRNLVSSLSYRMRALERSNSLLRTAYDRITTQVQDAKSPLLGNSLTAATVSVSQLSPLTQDHRFDILELDRYDDIHLLSQEVMETIVQVQEVTSDIELSLEDADRTARDLGRTSKQMQTSLTQVRMRPLSDILNRFPRALREMCVQYHKKVELQVYGGGTLIDRTVLEALSDPLMHLLRNAFDHGIEDPLIRQAYDKPEQGTIEIRAAYRGSQTLITVSDDGGGIDLDKIRLKAIQQGYDEESVYTASDRDLLDLIFEPGFSTASQVTALSGRGVGMDVVRTNLRKVRGDIRVDTQPGVGTTFTISVPFTLSVMRALMVESQGMMLAFPKDEIEEVLLLKPESVIVTAGNEFLKWEEQLLPLIRLGQCLQFHCPRRSWDTEDSPIISEPMVLLLTWGDELAAVQVDRCWGEQEVAIRQVDGTLALPPGFAGCSILGNGRVVPLVDPQTLISQILPTDPGNPTTSLPQPTPPPPVLALEPAASQQKVVLIIDDSVVVRRYLALVLEKAGYWVEQAKDGQDALDKLLGGLEVQAIICDIEMPRLDGYSFLHRMKAESQLRHLPVAMLTSRSGDKHRQLAMNLGAAAYFTKPFREQTLLQTLEHLALPQAVS